MPNEDKPRAGVRTSDQWNMAASPQQLLELCRFVDEYNSKPESDKVLMEAEWDDLVHIIINEGIISDWHFEKGNVRETLYTPSRKKAQTSNGP